MLTKKSFTLTEILTVTAIIVIVTGAMSFWLASLWEETEMMNIENIIKMRIRSQKMSILAWEIDCSQVSLYYKTEYFSVFTGERKNNKCEKQLLWQIATHSLFKNRWNSPIEEWEVWVGIRNDRANSEINIFWSWNSHEIKDHTIKNYNWNNYISFYLWNEQTYMINVSHGNTDEQYEIIFYNDEIADLNINDPKTIILNKIEWLSHRKSRILWEELIAKIIWPSSIVKYYLNWIQVDNIKLQTKNWNEIVNDFSI